MDAYTVMVMENPLAPVRRYQIPKVLVRRVYWIVAAVVLVFSGAAWDYWSVRQDNAELDSLRVVAAEQQQQILLFDQTLGTVEAELARVRELERKVRIIANLPGLAAVGGAEVTDLEPPDETTALEGVLPEGVTEQTSSAEDGDGRSQGRGGPEEDDELVIVPQAGLTTPEARRIFTLELAARELEAGAEVRGDSLLDLAKNLESKADKLSSMPSVWPTRGWLTSRFGYRTSPFTGRRQHHGGIDIATKQETPIIAPATGRVSFVGAKGPLGNAVVLDHGYGVRTFYGHTHEIHVKTGDKVERGQRIASVGSTGRSTGPHLHYSVEVGGKSVNPMNYIFD
jgi:murein DD-endopeptidase MepM/ murein hydrolase activator NlpD